MPTPTDSVALTVFQRCYAHYCFEIPIKGALRLEACRKIYLRNIMLFRAEHFAGVSYPVIVQHCAEAYPEILFHQKRKVSRMVSRRPRYVLFT